MSILRHIREQGEKAIKMADLQYIGGDQANGADGWRAYYSLDGLRHFDLDAGPAPTKAALQRAILKDWPAHRRAIHEYATQMVDLVGHEHDLEDNRRATEEYDDACFEEEYGE